MMKWFESGKETCWTLANCLVSGKKTLPPNVVIYDVESEYRQAYAHTSNGMYGQKIGRNPSKRALCGWQVRMVLIVPASYTIVILSDCYIIYDMLTINHVQARV